MITWYIPSRGRAITATTPTLLPEATLVVRPDEVLEYSKHFPNRVLSCECDGITPTRNWILGLHPAGSDVVLLDDDLRKFVRFRSLGKTRNRAETVAPEEVKREVEKLFLRAHEQGVPALLFGIGLTCNPVLYHRDRPVSSNVFIVGSFMAIRISPLIRFDCRAVVKEDYDYTCACIDASIPVFRLNYFAADHRHGDSTGEKQRESRGGCDLYRTSDVNARACSYLLGKWPQFLFPHPTRPNELLLRAKP